MPALGEERSESYPSPKSGFNLNSNNNLYVGRALFKYGEGLRSGFSGFSMIV
jgi:hypothetical protein